MRDYTITRVGLFLHEHKMSKTFFLDIKEKEKISSNHFMPSGDQKFLLICQMAPVPKS